MVPRVLIIDDLFGRRHADRANSERGNLCSQYLLQDATGDEIDKPSRRRVLKPVAEVVFCRGQQPACSTVGDRVENDLEGTLEVVHTGWERRDPGTPRWALVLLDLCFYTGTVTTASDRQTLGMPEGRQGDDDPRSYFGLHVLRALHEQFPHLPVVILSSMSRQEVSLEFATHGALAFLPRSDEQSPELLKQHLWTHGLLEDDSGTIIGCSLPLLLALRAARRTAADRRNVLIRGERGTGKELFARYLHRQGHRSGPEKPYEVVNTPALGPELFASELFGHVRGAFTGATDNRTGRILEAEGGDLFLDEIANMPAAVQTGVLRVLENRQVSPVGGTSSRHVDVRFLSATNEDIEARVACGTFREDLLDRLREGGMVFLPPLRERREDIPLLTERFIRDAVQSSPAAMRRAIATDALERLSHYDWPGNIRELRSCIFNAVLNHPDVEHLVSSHLHLPQAAGLQREVLERPLHPGRAGTASPTDLNELIARLRDFPANRLSSAELAGKLPALQQEFARLVAKLIQAAVEATRRATVDHPAGKILIHPAMKLLTGDRDLTASQAADLLKRLLKLDPQAIEPLLAEPPLRETLEIAQRIRPKRRSPGSNVRNP